jgi:hypothetical protein
LGSHLSQKPQITEIHTNEERRGSLNKSRGADESSVSTQCHDRIGSLNDLAVGESRDPEFERFRALRVNVYLKPTIAAPLHQLFR